MLRNKIVYITLLFIFLIAVSCKNSGNNTTETFSLQSTITPSNAGSVSPSGGSFDSGEQVQITATANDHFVFKEWNGDLSGSNNPASVTITKNMSINALFEELTYPLTIEVEGDGEVSEQIVNAKTDYAEGTTVELTAEPADGWEFVSWSGDLDGTENPATITMDAAKNVTATFELKTYSLTVNVEGEGEVSEEIVNSKATNYTDGTTVELTAEPQNEWRFVNWTGDLEGTENPATVTMDQNKSINAIFEFGFNEDFEDDTADNWQFSDDRFSVADGKLRFSTGRDGNWAGGVYDQIFSDFKMEVRATRTRSAATLDYTLAMFLRANGNVAESLLQNGYMVGITQSGYGAVFKYENGVETQFSPWVVLSALNDKLGEYNVVTVNAVGSVFEIYANGEYIITITDDTFSEGYTGIGTYASDEGENRLFWEYVKVTKADPLRNKKEKVLDTSSTLGSVDGNSSGPQFQK